MEEKKMIENEESKETNVCKTQTEGQANNEEVLAKKTLRPIYARDSMERFGDDLTEEVLQYLWFSDKVMFECLSKQWQRLIFNKQFELDLTLKAYRLKSKNSLNKLPNINDNDMYMEALESVLKKCPNISRVYLPHKRSGEELDLINKYCRRVRKLFVYENCEDEALKSFAARHGQWLEEIVFVEEFGMGRYVFECMDSFLPMCPNIKKIDIDKLGWTLNDLIGTLGNISLTKLQVIRSFIIIDGESNGLKQLFDNYGTSLKGLKIIIAITSSDELKTCFAHISRFESLESLELEIYENKEQIDESLKKLAKKCTKLKELGLKANKSSVISNGFFFALSEFRSLERLVLDFEDITDKLEGSVECFKHMTRLKHLSINYSQLNEDFFANIPSHLPNLRYLNIKSIPGDSIKPFVESLQNDEMY